MIKYSRQREIICQFLNSRKDHPTAETIYLGIRDENPNISLGTVYRNLSLLSDIGRIQKIIVDRDSERFDPDPRPHYHFCCDCCHAVSDIPMSPMDSLNQLAQAYIYGQVRSHSLVFRGICGSCMEKNTAKEQTSVS